MRAFQTLFISGLIEYLVKFSRVVFEICERTNKQTDRQTDRQTTDILITILHTPPRRKMIAILYAVWLKCC